MMMTWKRKLLFYLLLIVSAAVLFAPAILAFLMSFMTSQDTLTGQIIPSVWTFENYIQAFQRFPLMNYLLNSLIVSFVIMIGQLILCSLAAYAFVFLKFKGRDALFFVFIATMMIPFEASIIPNFQTIRELGLLNTYPGLTLPFFCDGVWYISATADI